MVAYGFKGRFVAPIRSGLKRHTMRNDRKRHARPGEPVQIYEKMRQKGCAKIIPDPLCERVEPVRLDFHNDTIKIGMHPFITQPAGLDHFARSDGFTDWEDMRAFWKKEHKKAYPRWEGVIVYWLPMA